MIEEQGEISSASLFPVKNVIAWLQFFITIKLS